MDAEKQQSHETRNGPGPVIRVRVLRRDGKWQVVKRVKVAEMTIPISHELPKLRPHRRLAGFWFEAVDEAGEVLYRRRLRTPVPGVEVFGEGGGLSRATAEIEGYTIDLLVPDLPQIRAVHLFHEGLEVHHEKEKPAIDEPYRPSPVGVFPARDEQAGQEREKGGEGDGDR